jgi:hypothetical protein
MNYNICYDMYLIVLYCYYLELSVTNLQVTDNFGEYILVASTYDIKQQATNYWQHRKPCFVKFLIYNEKLTV